MRERQRHRRKGKQAPCREPNVELDPRTPGSCPGPKAGAKPLSHPGIPAQQILNKRFVYFIVGGLYLNKKAEAKQGKKQASL